MPSVLFRPLPIVLLGLCLVGCSDAAANTRDPLQGVLEYEDVILGLEVGGRVSDLKVARGDRVLADAILLTLDDGMERPLRDARQAELAFARAQLELLQAGARPEEIRGARVELRTVEQRIEVARRNQTRQAGLVEHGALAPSVLDVLEAEITTLEGHRDVLQQRVRGLRSGARDQEISAATARVDSAMAALAALDARLSRYTLHAAQAGDVVDVHVSRGEIAAPGAPAVTIADLDHPFADVFVPEARMSEVRVGMRARVRVDGVRQPITGRVEHIFPRTEFTPRFLFSDTERPNLVLRVRVRIEDTSHSLHAGIPVFVELDGGVR
jgi:HlyD family secretion protein